MATPGPELWAPGPTSSRRIGPAGEHHPADVLRLRRRRRRPDPRDAGEHPRDGRISRHAPHAATARSATFSEQLESEAGDQPAHLERRTVPGTATAAPTPPRAATSAPTARASSCSTTPSSWPRWPVPRSATIAYPHASAAPGLGTGLPQPVPRHHPRQQHWRRSTSSRRSSMPRCAAMAEGVIDAGADRPARADGGDAADRQSDHHLPAADLAFWPDGGSRPPCISTRNDGARFRSRHVEGGSCSMPANCAPYSGHALRRGRTGAGPEPSQRRWLSPRQPCWKMTSARRVRPRQATSPASTTRSTAARCCPPAPSPTSSRPSRTGP